MNEFRLIMLSAMYENGGNTTHRLLDGHPNLHVYPFESQVGTGGTNDYLSSYVPIRYRWPEFSGDATAESAYEAFWDEELKTLLRVPSRSKFRTCGLEMDEAARKKWFCDFLADKPVNRRNCIEAYYRSTFETWTNLNRSGEETTYVGYNPVQCLDTDKIFRDFPNAHVLHVVRNPWSGFADTSKRPFPLSLVRYTWTWNLCQIMALTYAKKYPGQFHVVRFEDIVGDTKGTMTNLLGDLGLPFSEHCLHPSFNRERLEEVYPWGTVRIPTPEVNAATANELTNEQKQQIRVEADVMIQALGYEDYFKKSVVNKAA